MAETLKSPHPKTRTQKQTIKQKAAKPVVAATPSRDGLPKTAPACPAQNPGAGRPGTPEERWNMIADAAYYRAEKRHFVGGDPHEDWLQAEAEIDAQLAKRTLSEEG